jgi:protein TonB
VFQPFKKSSSDFKSEYKKNLEKSLILTLASFIALIYLSPRLRVQIEKPNPPNILMTVENVPLTRQVRLSPPPPKPTIPVPSEDESIPEDVTIEETTLKYSNLFDETPYGLPGFSGINIVPPRPIAWVFPEYPEEDKKKGVKGLVKLSIQIDEHGNVVEVIVIENTTGSENCAKAAIEAAYGSRFFPAREGNKPVKYWITQPYRFDLSN